MAKRGWWDIVLEILWGVVGVPMRLSASEVEGGDSDDDGDSGRILYHRRTGSGRSSVGSGRRGLTYSRQSGASSNAGRWSSGNTPPSEKERQNSFSGCGGGWGNSRTQQAFNRPELLRGVMERGVQEEH
ncbi:hypothetical protein EYC84_005063 [Monilinia fructicola]|uniref:Uncharacterized protein n=1 Tax=Monilinia fructicola TaxID=38448 RepID=A0A5M9JVD9_MONFR|nr:hypothetical protein EYC84_005063 [Monilinia fructicola]